MTETLANCVKMNFALLEDSIKEEYGPRCPDFNGNCIGCLAWAAYDALTNRRAVPAPDVAVISDFQIREIARETELGEMNLREVLDAMAAHGLAVVSARAALASRPAMAVDQVVDVNRVIEECAQIAYRGIDNHWNRIDVVAKIRSLSASPSPDIGESQK